MLIALKNKFIATMIIKLLIIGAGGFIGAIFRFLLIIFFNHHFSNKLFSGILFVNSIGCFTFGIILSTLKYSKFINENLKIFLTIGFLGALTTFSSFSFELFTFFLNKQFLLAFLNILLSIILGVSNIFLGYWIAKLLLT